MEGKKVSGSLTFKLINKKEVWERFVLSQHPNVFLQSWNWGEAHRLLGKKIFRLGLYENKKLVGVAQVIKEGAKRGDYFALPGGPILLEWKEGWLNFLFGELKKIGKNEGIVFIRIRPNIENTLENRQLFKKLGFVLAPMHLHAETTLQIDLKQPEETILAKMRKNTRYSIRRAERDGVKTEVSQDVADIDRLYQLQIETQRRHQFVPFSQEFFEKHFEAFLKDNQISLIKASWQGEVLAAGMFVFYGDTAVYHYSGYSSKYPKIPASYAMLWRAIKEAKKRGCRLFDLWGIAPTNDPRHRFAGVTLFKKGFDGQRVDWVRAQDLPISRSYWLIFAFETARRLKRRL